jgi:hypothetical protein
VTAPLAIGGPIARMHTLRVTLPQRSPPAPATAPASYQVLRTNRVPAQLSLFERPPVGR